MTNSTRDKITADLQKAKEEGKVRTERIREIVKAAVTETATEVKVGSQEIRALVRDAVSAVIEVFRDRGEAVKEEVTASIEGAIEGISDRQRQAIAQTEAEVQQLQAQLDQQEEELKSQIDTAIEDVEEVGKQESQTIRSAIESAILAIRNSEEVALMQKRYAQLKAQLAIIQANLAEGKSGERYEEVQQYLEKAKSWYERAKEDPEIFTQRVEEKRTEFEGKLGEAGGAIARRETRVRQILRDLWQSISELFREKDREKREETKPQEPAGKL